MFSRLIRYATFAFAIMGVIKIGLIVRDLRAESGAPIPPPPITPPAKSDGDIVAASGILEAQSENVAVGVPEPGLVTEVMVTVSQRVQKGEPLFQLDPSALDAELITQQAAVESARAALEVARAQTMVEKAALDKAVDMQDRLEKLGTGGVVSEEELSGRRLDTRVAKSRLGASAAQEKAAEVEFAAAEARVLQTRALLARLTVRAPRDGVILQSNIRAGEFASTSPRSPAILLGDLDTLQVRADVDEQSASRVRPGVNGVCYVKGRPDQAIPIEFVRIEPYIIPKVSLTGSATERVDTRVLQVIFRMTKPKDFPVYAGQQVDVNIAVDSEQPTNPSHQED